MLRWCAVLALVLLPGVQACSGQATALLDLRFPPVEGCERGLPDGCPPLPEADEPLVLEGELVWSWDLENCATVLVPSLLPVHITFEPVHRYNAGWLDLSVEPREILIPPDQQFDVTDDFVDPGTGAYRAEERYPLTVTIALVGEPDEPSLHRLDNDAGVATMFLKAASGSTSTFQASFGIEQFRMDARSMLPSGADGRDAPLPPLAFVLAALALAVVVRRP